MTRCVDKTCPSRKACQRAANFKVVDRDGYADFDRQGGDWCEAYEPKEKACNSPEEKPMLRPAQ